MKPRVSAQMVNSLSPHLTPSRICVTILDIVSHRVPNILHQIEEPHNQPFGNLYHGLCGCLRLTQTLPLSTRLHAYVSLQGMLSMECYWSSANVQATNMPITCQPLFVSVEIQVKSVVLFNRVICFRANSNLVNKSRHFGLALVSGDTRLDTLVVCLSSSLSVDLTFSNFNYLKFHSEKDVVVLLMLGGSSWPFPLSFLVRILPTTDSILIAVFVH